MRQRSRLAIAGMTLSTPFVRRCRRVARSYRVDAGQLQLLGADAALAVALTREWER